jgi:hypothetical protein
MPITIHFLSSENANEVSIHPGQGAVGTLPTNPITIDTVGPSTIGLLTIESWTTRPNGQFVIRSAGNRTMVDITADVDDYPLTLSGGSGLTEEQAESIAMILPALNEIKGTGYVQADHSLAERSTGGGIGGGGDATLAKQNTILAEIAKLTPQANTFSGQNRLDVGDTMYLVQRDDYSASDGRAFVFNLNDPAINYTLVTVTMGAAGGGTPGSPVLVGTASLTDKANGSAKLRIEFSSTQTNVPAGTYQFDAHILVAGRRITQVQLTAEVAPKYAD